MEFTAILFAILAGFCTSIEHTINSRLGAEITPSVATLHNLIVGVILMLAATIASGNITRYGEIRHISPVLLIGGIFGALIIYLPAKAVPVIGVTKTLTLIVAGQLACGIVADLFLYDISIDYKKGIGFLLVIIGTALISNK